MKPIKRYCSCNVRHKAEYLTTKFFNSTGAHLVIRSQTILPTVFGNSEILFLFSEQQRIKFSTLCVRLLMPKLTNTILPMPLNVYDKRSTGYQGLAAGRLHSAIGLHTSRAYGVHLFNTPQPLKTIHPSPTTKML